MQSQSLKKKAINGFFWSFLEKFSVRGISFIIGIILARLLTPSDYGLLGMLAVFIAVSQLFIESGFSKALVQKENRNEVDFSTVFFFNLIVSILFYFILFYEAPLIADFYSTPQLTCLLRILSLNIILGSFNIVQRAKLLIAIDFKTTARANFVGVVLGGFIGIALAYFGFGVWALVVQTLSTTILVSLILGISTKWLPQLVFSFASLKSMFSFGSKLLFAGLYATILNNIYIVAIGKHYNSKDLGYYTRANQITDFTAGTISEIIGIVTYPLLSSVQQERDRLISIYSRMLSMTAFFVFPIMTLLAVLSEPFVSVVLTDKWLPIVPLIHFLCFARVFTPISSLNMNILNAVGRSDLFLKVDLLKLPLVILAMIITIPLGIKAIVVGDLITTFLCYFINAYYPGKMFGYGALKQLNDWKYFILSSFVMAFVVMFTMIIISNPLFQLILGSLVGIFVYLIMTYYFKVKEIYDISVIIKEGIFKK